MADINDLMKRIDDEFTAGEQRIKAYQSQQLQSYEARQSRLEAFERACARLRDIWNPRLEALSKKFGERVKVTPRTSRDLREATFDFESSLAQIQLKFTASTDEEVHHLVLDYRLEIVPILMKFDPHQQVEFLLDAIDEQAVARWIDDRILDFVRTYLSLHQNEFYLKNHMVIDPVTSIRFPKFAAAATLDWQGKTYYFIDNKTRKEFEAQHPVA